MDFEAIKAAAEGYKADMSRFLREMISHPSESCEEKEVVMCACSNKEMYLVQQAVKAADRDSFIVILESNEVHGEGFRMLEIGEYREKAVEEAAENQLQQEKRN